MPLVALRWRLKSKAEVALNPVFQPCFEAPNRRWDLTVIASTSEYRTSPLKSAITPNTIIPTSTEV